MKGNQWLKRLATNRFLRSVVYVSSATAVGQMVLLLATPILTRLYNPTDFGALAVFNAIAAVIVVVSSLRLEFAVPLPKSDRNGKILLGFAVAINGAVALFTLFVFAMWSDALAERLSFPAAAPYLLIIPLYVLGAGSYKALSFWAIRKSDFRTIAQTKIVQSVSNVAVQVAAGLAGLGVLGLIAGLVVGSAMGVIRLLRLAGSGGGLGTFWRGRLRARILARRYDRFPKYDVVAALIDTVAVQLPNLLLAVLFSPAIAGFYMLAERALTAPMSMLGQAVGQVLYASSGDAIAKGRLVQLVSRIVAGLSAVVMLPALIVFLAGEHLFAFVFGEVWREAGVFAGWIVLGLAVQFVYSSISLVLLATDGQRINLLIHTFLLVFKVAAVLYGFEVGSPLAAIIGFTVVSVVGYAGAIFVVFYHARAHAIASARRN